MTKIAKCLIAAMTLAGPTMSLAGTEPSRGAAKPSSFAPQHHSNSHIYGSPIGQPILGHAKASHGKRVQKKRATGQ